MLALRSLLLCAIAAALMALPSAALATGNTYVVGAPEMTTGSCDVNNACSFDYALSLAGDQDTVYVEHGTYIHAAGKLNPSTMLMENNSSVFLAGGATLKGAPGLPRPTVVQNDPYNYSAPTTCNCGLITAFSGARITHMSLVQHDVTAGEGALGMQDGVTIDDSEIIGDAAGARAIAGPAPTTVQGSLIVGGHTGLVTDGAMNINQSTIVGEINEAILNQVGSATAVSGIHNSIVYSPSGTDIFATATTGSVTIHAGGSLTRIATAFTAGAAVIDGTPGGNIEGAPIFANEAAGNYREAANSPSVDAGSGVVAFNDLDDRPFTNGRGPDVGAYEYYAPPPAITPPVLAKKLAVSKPKITAKRKHGKVSVKITCPKTAIGTCSGSVAIKQGSKTKTTKFSKLKPGKTKTLKIKAKKGKSSITLTETDGSGASGSQSVSKKIK